VKAVPLSRISSSNDKLVNADGEYVLYWMTAARRMRWNYALDRAIEHAGRLDKPLVVLEALRSGYPWASDRLHKFILDGMSDNLGATSDTPLLYYPYVEKAAGEGAG
jgi:deoxyribodipyrimidine photo-lyase